MGQNITTIDSKNIKVNDFYNFKIDEWEELTKKFNVDRISEFSDNKKEFYNWISQFGFEVSIFSFCKAVLKHYELPNNKDICYITAKESYHLIKELAQTGAFTSQSQFNVFTRLLEKYTIWSMQVKKTRNDLLDSKCWDSYENLLNKEKISDELLTKREINTLLYNLSEDESLMELLVLLTLNGLDTTEIRTITKSQVLEIKDNLLTMDNRTVSLDSKTLDKLYKFATSTTTIKKTRTGYKEAPLINSDYVVRTTITSKNTGYQANPISKNSLSTLSRRVFTRLGYEDISLRTIRNSAIVHDYLDNKSILEIQNKYGVTYLDDEAHFRLNHKYRIKVMQEKENTI